MDAKYENVKIKIFASSKKQIRYDERDESRIADIIREQVLPKTKFDYLSVNVKIKRDQESNPQYMIGYMNRKDTYTADVIKVNLNENLDVTEIEEDYDDSEDYDDEESSYSMPEYDRSEVVDFVAGTPVPEIPTALQAIDDVINIAATIGLKVKKLIGHEASVANYKKYLLKGVKGFVNVGHGYTGGIVLDDGRLRFTWFQGLSGRPISPAVVYFNSCQVFNPPLLPEVMDAGARTYIGGIINLLIGPSEKVCKAFWKSILENKVQMGTALRDAENQEYPVQGAHGIKGDQGLFKADMRVGILAFNNRFVCANRGGGSTLIANRTWIRSWETFNLYNLTPDSVALQSSNFKYVCAEGGGGRELLANRDHIAQWETFKVLKQAGNRISFKAFNGKLVCAENGGTSHLMANRNNQGPWETFEFIPVKRIGLKANNNKFVCAENGGGRELMANRELLRRWETFKLTELTNDQIALQCMKGTYVCAENAGEHHLVANRNWIRTWEIFTIEKQPDGKVAFKACNGKYISAVGEQALIANSDNIGADELFTLIEIDGHLELELNAVREEPELEIS